jgi:Mg-chelatase subunit ChlD
VVITNTSAKKIFLMRADADRGVKVYTSKKTLLPEDTCLVIISFIPETNGKFKKKIDLVATDKQTPYQILLSGNIARVKTNDRMACVYFGKRKSNPVAVKEEPIIVPPGEIKRDNSNKLPGSSETPKVTQAPKPSVQKTSSTEFSEDNYRPNNIVFLVDISSSMRDSLKLPVMKMALHRLIDAVRNVDTISFVTYASKVKTILEARSGMDKKALHELVDSLHARGMTAGRTAILYSQLLAQKHYIKDGNNQIIIATDGEFKFEQEDFMLWKKRQSTKKITLSTVAFGQDKNAHRNLKEIAHKGEGSFIAISKREGSEEKLLDEIKMRSKKQ